ncbi:MULTISPECIES: YopJ family acetyltransferase [Pandoraea]|uniref:Effector protein YopJ n=1 Tax=Pandoraea communis TaxID=2508297 RepID=A0A5E4SEJ8_9BURK|nr:MULTISPECIES: YopJ family acetyltransferase [Pandoraea]EON13868.1 effector protein YopJ [Pandoraea sp. SD6-2]VVD72588.1 effector protein YopJ [Pandoraea communis]
MMSLPGSQQRTANATTSPLVTLSHPEGHALPGKCFSAALHFAGNVPFPEPDVLKLPDTPTHYYNFAVAFLKANRQSMDMYWADRDAIPALIRSEMSLYPGLRISHHPTPAAFAAYVSEQCRTQASHREQCLIELSPKEGHCVGADLSIDAGEPTIIVIESSTLNATGSAMLLLRLANTLKDTVTCIARNGLGRHLMLCETGAQQSRIDCAMFSLCACKSMFRSAAAFTSLHARLRAGEFSEMLDKGYAASSEADLLLPSALMQHTQSSTRLADYARRRIRHDPAQALTVGKLIRRQKGLVFARDERTYSVSIEMARIKMAGRALPPPAQDMTLLAPPRRDDFMSSTESQ